MRSTDVMATSTWKRIPPRRAHRAVPPASAPRAVRERRVAGHGAAGRARPDVRLRRGAGCVASVDSRPSPIVFDDRPGLTSCRRRDGARAGKKSDEPPPADGCIQTDLRRQRPSSCRVDVVVFRSTFKRGSNPSGEARQPLFTAPQPRNEQADAPEPPRAPEPEAKREVQQYQRDMHTSAGSGDFNASLGKGTEFEGKLAFEGKVRIDGTFTGEISTSDTLHIGEGAKVSAEISCGTIIVEGDVVGNIKATGAVELHRPAKVRGDITSPSLSIEKGVIFEGRSKMESVEASNVVNLRAASEEA